MELITLIMAAKGCGVVICSVILILLCMYPEPGHVFGFGEQNLNKIGKMLLETRQCLSGAPWMVHGPETSVPVDGPDMTTQLVEKGKVGRKVRCLTTAERWSWF